MRMVAESGKAYGRAPEDAQRCVTGPAYSGYKSRIYIKKQSYLPIVRELARVP